jgi:hypothetical protein
MEHQIPSPPSGSNLGAARAFARVGWTTVWAALLDYATGTLRLPAPGARRAGVVEAAELVSTLLLKSVEGTLSWTLPEHATDEEIVGHACTKLFGMRSTLGRKAARTTTDDTLDERPDPGPDALAKVMAKRRVEDLEGAFAHDAEAYAYLREMLKEETRPEIASTLGMPVERAKVVQKRVMRRIAAHARTANDDGEDGPPSSGP